MGKTNFKQIALEKISKQVYRKVYDKLKEVPDVWYKYIKDEMEAPKHGFWYYNSKTKTMYQASAPGEYPARKTPAGHEQPGLLDMLKVFLGSYNDNNKFIRIYITSGAYYTQYLEDQGRRLIEASKKEFFELAIEELEDLKGRGR